MMTNKSIEEIVNSDPETLSSDERHLRISYRCDIGRGIEPNQERTEAKFEAIAAKAKAEVEAAFASGAYVQGLHDEIEELYAKLAEAESTIEKLSKDK